MCHPNDEIAWLVFTTVDSGDVDTLIRPDCLVCGCNVVCKLCVVLVFFPARSEYNK